MSRPVADVERVRALAGTGQTASEISRATGVPRTTVREWLTGARLARRPTACWRCESTAIVRDRAGAYVYLLGVYLGDGTITRVGRTFRLTVVQDARYPALIDEWAGAMAAVLPNKVIRQRRPGCVLLSAYSNHWPCLFPQHGPGRKHERPIELTDWQRELVAVHADRLVAGLIHSDGSRHLNKVTTRGKQYAYVRYDFTNASTDIQQIFVDACRALGITPTRTGPRRLAVSRHADVRRLDELVGPKH